MSLYLILDLFTISLPLFFSFTKKYYFYDKWRSVWFAISITAIFFLIWDVYFTSIGVWGFNPDYLVGLYFFGLPIEEWLFFLCIPYACLFTYHCLKLLKLQEKTNFITIISWAIVIILFVSGLSNFDKSYSSVTFLMTSIFLSIYLIKFKTKHLQTFYLSYLIIFLFPFILVNGILTGSFISEPIVWYNNNKNLSFRVLTIPIEDFVYGFLLYLMNVTLFEFFQFRYKLKSV